jgi:hypothetical protein
MSFNDELEFYDLLELDANGEEDADSECADIDLDGTRYFGSIVTNVYKTIIHMPIFFFRFIDVGNTLIQ